LDILLFCTLFFIQLPPPPRSPLFPYTTLFRSLRCDGRHELENDREYQEIRKRHSQQKQKRARDDQGQHQALLVHIQTRRDERPQDRKSTRLNSSHDQISYAVFCLKKKKKNKTK